MDKKFAVIGLGQFGRAIAKKLSFRGAEVLAIDMNHELVDNIKDDVAMAVSLDATDKKALMAHNITDFNAVVVAIGENFEQRLLCASLLLDLNVKRVIARANGRNQRIILSKMGIKEILSPEDEVGVIIAERLINPSIVSYLQLPDDYRIVELNAPAKISNRTIEDLDLRDKYKLSLITIKKQYNFRRDGNDETEYHIQGVPNSKTIIEPTDSIVIFGKNKDIEKFTEINS